MAIDQYGQIIRRSPRPIPINTVPYHTSPSTNGFTYTYENLSLWDRFDNFIRRIGNWFAEYSENITGLIAIVICAIGAIMFISWLISLGWLWGIVAGIFLGGIVYYAVLIVAGIFIFLGNIALGIVRYIFYNCWTFLITLAIILGFTIFGGCSHQTYKPSQAVETVAPSYSTTAYRCTAKVLNVRRGPGAGYDVVGKLYRGQTVEVIDGFSSTNGFIKVLYNDSEGYVSERFITRK